jgi:hypothetical protein
MACGSCSPTSRRSPKTSVTHVTRPQIIDVNGLVFYTSEIRGAVTCVTDFLGQSSVH